MNRKWRNAFSITLILSIIFLFFSTWYANRTIEKCAEGKTFSSLDSLPHVKVGLLLGTSKYGRGRQPNQFFSNRIKACVELFKAGKIEDIIISGDNSRTTYDEPTDMRNELLKAGIDSTKIYLDYAGFRTYDSMVRLLEIFGQRQVIVISQKFHNERAIYIGDKLGIETYGYNAADVSKFFGLRTLLREKLARVKVILDFCFGVKPKFLGPHIEIR